MADGRHYPDRWNEYKKLKNRDPQRYDPKWVVFASRYNVASSYHSMSFFGLSNDLKRLYSALFHLPLALSALEAACEASDLALEGITIFDRSDDFSEISKNIRDFYLSVRHNAFVRNSPNDDGAMPARIENFSRAKNGNLISIAFDLRHYLFVGAWSPVDLKSIRSYVAPSIEELCRLIIIKSDRIFEEFLMRERQR